MTGKYSAKNGRERQGGATAQQAASAVGATYPSVERARRARARRRATIALLPSHKRIRRWRDLRTTPLIRGQLVTHRRTSFVIQHKSKQRRWRHRHY
jgi:hypothetical protein